MFDNYNPSQKEGFFSLKEKILEDSERVFKYYFKPDFELNRYYESPLRKEENPSFNIFKGRDGVLLFKDWGGKSGNVIDFVALLHNTDFYKAVDLITNRLNIKKRIKLKKKKERKKNEIILTPLYRRRNGNFFYTNKDIYYWNELGVNIERVFKHNILSAHKLYIGKNLVINAENDKSLFIEIENYEGKSYMKTYYPDYSDIRNKWRNNMRGMYDKLIHNYKNIPKKGDTLIVTKSFKDCLVLESLGFIVVSTQGEDVPIYKDIVEDLHRRYNNIYLLYDNDFSKKDNVGRRLGNKYASLYNFKQIEIPDKFKVTDSADFYKKHGRLKLKKTIINEIKRRDFK